MRRPSTSSTRPLRLLALPAVLALGAAACDQPTAPAARPAIGAASMNAAADGAVPLTRPVLHSSRARYRDAGHHPATGRSGSASLSARALLGRDGTTELEMSTGDVSDPWSTAPGSLVRVQVKSFSPRGSLLETRNETLAGGARASLALRPLVRGAVVRAQAGVRGVDARRTDVVSVADPVMLRPNLRVAGVSAPAAAAVGDYVNVAATIRETNGDVGNWATCTLFVDGVAVDAAPRVWVDAGDAVTCAFTHRFAEGTHALLVRVNAAPGATRDDYAGDDTASATLVSVRPRALFYGLGASDLEQRDSVVWVEHTPSDPNAAYGREYREVRTSSTRAENVFLNLYTSAVLAEPQVRLDVRESSGGRTVQARAYALTLEYLGGGEWCACGQGEDGGASIHLCTGGWINGTSLFYDRFAGRVTYHSTAYTRTWDRATGEETVYSYNTSGSEGVATPFTGGDFAMRVRLSDRYSVFAADPALTLEGQEQRSHNRYSCQTFMGDEYCSESTTYTRIRSGWTTNQ
jgi:hypothetical protein